jgi:peptidoglycan/xylan/chitin deacetylase (PgdA/CDA1 family)
VSEARDWPGGAGVAVSLVLNIEDGAERSIARGDRADDKGAHWLEHRTSPTSRNLSLESAFEYGARAGIWRVLRTLREFDVRATAFCCARALQACPPVAAALLRDGHEIGNHGLLWDTHTDLTPAQERAAIAESTRLIEQLTGVRPTSWYSRDGRAESTLASALAEGCCRYDCNSFSDDAPYQVAVGERAVTVVPYAGDTNDSGLVNRFRTADDFAGYLCDSLDTLVAECGTSGVGTAGRPPVLSVGLHPRLIGRPGSIKALRVFLEKARATPQVWFATRSEIAEHWGGQQPAGASAVPS